MTKSKSYFIVDGNMHEVDSMSLEPIDGKTQVTAILDNSSTAFEDVITNIQIGVENDFFVPIFDGGVLRAKRVRQDRTEVYMLEFQPSRREISLAPGLSGKRAHKFILPFPYVYLFVKIREGMWDTSIRCYPYYRNTPITSLTDSLYFSNLPNVYSNQSACIRTNMTGLEGTTMERISAMVFHFWNNIYNGDVLSRWLYAVEAIPNHPQTFSGWKGMGNSYNWKERITSLAWLPAGVNVDQALDGKDHPGYE